MSFAHASKPGRGRVALLGSISKHLAQEYRKRGDVERDRATEYLREQAVEARGIGRSKAERDASLHGAVADVSCTWKVSRQKEVDAARTRRHPSFSSYLNDWNNGLRSCARLVCCSVESFCNQSSCVRDVGPRLRRSCGLPTVATGIAKRGS